MDKFKTKLKNTHFFGWHSSEIIRLLRFSIQRITEGNLAQVAGSLTFTTVLSLVPMLTVAFAIFTAFPLFTTFHEALEAYFIQNLMPHALSEHILNYLNQFSAKAARLSAFGAIALMGTALITLATIDHVFNQIWRVKHKRPLFKRLMVYWVLITFAPLLLGVSLSLSSYLYAVTSGVVEDIIGSKVLYTLTSTIFTTGAFTLLYFAVPNRRVDWRDAAWGGLIAAILFEIAKRAFAGFVMHIPTYTIVYGAIAIIPMFLIWIYTSWLIALIGAVITASLPIVKYERWWHVAKPGGQFIDAMAILEVLVEARTASNLAGVSTWDIRQKTKLGFDEIENLIDQMSNAGWVGHLHAPAKKKRKHTPLLGSEWWVLLVNPSKIPMSDVYRVFLFEPQIETRLSKKVEQAIERGLQESVEDYFNSNT